MILLLCILHLFIFFIGLLLWLVTAKYSHLPGRGLPIVGNIYCIIKNFTLSPKGIIARIREAHEKYGDLIAFHIGPVVFISLKDPDLMEELVSHPQLLKKDKLIYWPLRGIFEGAFSRLRANQVWKQQRKCLASKLSKKYLDLYHGTFYRRSEELINKIASKTEEFNVHPWVMLMTLDIVLETHCAIHRQTLIEENIQIHKEISLTAIDLQQRIYSLGLLKTDVTYLRKRKHCYSFLLQVINEIFERRGMPKSEYDFESFCDKIMQLKLNGSESFNYTLKVITEMVIEAQYSTGTALSCALLSLGVYPEYQEKVWQEQTEIFGDSLEAPTTDDLTRMKYLERFVKEAIRFVSPPFVARRSTGIIKTAGGVVIPDNTSVIFFWDGLRKDRKYWKYGDRFNPDHFLPEEVAQRPKCADFAFSSGPRSCLGFRYAINCSKVVISNIVRNFKISSSLKPEDLTYKPILMTRLEVPHKVLFQPRIVN